MQQSPSFIFDLLDGPLSISIEEEWEEHAESTALISEANQAFSLVEYLDSRYSTQALISNNGWSRRMPCPFHKHGHERTPSCFVNSKKNRFYCQACGATGGLVQFVSFRTNRPEEWVAEHILKLAKNGGAVFLDVERERKLEEKKKIVRLSFEIADLFGTFIKNHIDDEAGLIYIDKLMSSFDGIRALDQDGVENNLEEILKNFQAYLEAYSLPVRKSHLTNKTEP